jgi:hypothetical protein
LTIKSASDSYGFNSKGVCKLNSKISADRKTEIARITAKHRCNPRTAAKMLRQEAGRSLSTNRQAVEAAAHLDWGNATDVPSEIREMAELIKLHGVRGVSNAERNKIAKGLPQAIRIAS